MRLHTEEVTEVEARCPTCGYQARGLTADQCPECGSTYLLRLADFDASAEFHAAAAALLDDGIEIENVIIPANTATFNQLFTSGEGQQLGRASIFVKRSDFRRASAILTLQIEEPPLPIVDRAEPVCPKCDVTIDSAGPEICPHCGASFLWVEIDQSPVDGPAVPQEVAPTEHDVGESSASESPSIIFLSLGLFALACVLALASEQIYLSVAMVVLASLMVVVQLLVALRKQRCNRP